MSDLWLLIPTAALGGMAWLAIRWQCHALSIVFTLLAFAALIGLS